MQRDDGAVDPPLTPRSTWLRHAPNVVTEACDNPRRLQRSATGSARPTSTGSSASGWPGSRTRSPAADRRAGYRYDISVLQAEFSLTQMLDQPVAGRVFFEQVIRDNLDAGRPDQVSLTFARRVTRRTAGRFRTRVITDGVIPSIHVDYKRAASSSTSKREPPFAQSARSTTPATSVSVAGCPTCPPCGRSASPPTGASSRCNESAAIRSPEPTPTTRCANRSSSATNESPPCVSTRPPPKRCSPRWWCVVCCPPGSPTATCEHSSHPCSGLPPEYHDPGPHDLPPAPPAPPRAHRTHHRAPTATTSPTSGSPPRCSSPAPTPASPAAVSPTSPDRTRPPRCARPSSTSTANSTGSQPVPAWRPERRGLDPART